MHSETIALNCTVAFVCDFGSDASVPASLCNAEIGGGRWNALSVTRSAWNLVEVRAHSGGCREWQIE